MKIAYKNDEASVAVREAFKLTKQITFAIHAEEGEALVISGWSEKDADTVAAMLRRAADAVAPSKEIKIGDVYIMPGEQYLDEFCSVFIRNNGLATVRVQVSTMLQETEPKAREYPYYGVLRDDYEYTVVYFTEESSGYVVASDIYEVGDCSKYWGEEKFQVIENPFADYSIRPDSL